MDAAAVTDLVRRAAQGDQRAWRGIVDEYGVLVWSVARGFRLSEAQTADAVQTTWLRLVEHLADIRDPERLPGWLRTTTRRACLAVARDHSRERVTDDLEQAPAVSWDGPTDAGPETSAVRHEQQVLVRRAVAALPAQQQALLGLLVASPAPSYAQISARLGMPVGSIGPTRARILARLRTTLETAGVHDAVPV